MIQRLLHPFSNMLTFYEKAVLYNEKAKSFAEIRNGPEDYNSLEQTVYNVSNIVLGVLTVIISILVVKQLGI